MTTLKPGDLVFYPDDGSAKHHIFSLLQKWSGQMGEIKGRGFTHVGMISTEPDLMIDMKWPRPRFSFFADDTREKVVMRPVCSDVVKLRAIYWFYFHINDHYSFWDMIMGKFGMANAYKFCSGMVDEAYKTSGFALTSTKDRLVSPNELISSKFLEIVDANLKGGF